jgi:hypothetical protein
MDRQTAIELLEEHHDFPGAFMFRVIVEPAALVPVEEALTALLGNAPTERTEAWSRTRKYCSLRLTYTVRSAEEVLDGFARMDVIEGVRVQL